MRKLNFSPEGKFVFILLLAAVLIILAIINKWV